MLERLLELDRTVFLFFNQPHSLYWDQVMWVYTGKIIWIPLVLVLGYVLFRKNWKEGLLTLLAIVLVVVVCDQVASSVFKPLFERLRPTRDPDFSPYVTIVNGYRGGLYGFASSHASNAFGLAVFTALLFRNRFYTAVALLWALLMCYSRMYVGVHYPGDLLAGAAIGLLAALLVYRYIYLALYRLLYRKGLYDSPHPDYPKEKASRHVAGTICFIFVFILLFSPFFDFRIH